SFKGWQKYRPHFARGGMGIGAVGPVTSTFRSAIDSKMFERRNHMLGLQTPGHRRAQPPVQIGIFTIRGRYASPAWVTGRICLRGVDIGVAQRAGLTAFYVANLVDKSRVPGTALANLHRKAGGLVGLQPADAFVG